MFRYSVDARLGVLNGRRVTSLVREDLPVVSRAIVCAIRGRARIEVQHWNHTPLIHLTGPSFDIYIRGSDWERILPYIVGGQFNPLIVATKPIGLRTLFDESKIDLAYDPLYQRVYGTLKTLFTNIAPNPDL